MLVFIDRDIPLDACTITGQRPIRGVVLHHSAGSTVPFPQRGASWHYAVNKLGEVYRDISENYAAHHTGATDRWRPGWVSAPLGIGVSAINYCSLGIEIIYAPQLGEVLQSEQYQAVYELCLDLETRWGPLWYVGHGEVDRSKWITEPHGFDWQQAGFGPLDDLNGRRLLRSEEMALTDDQRCILATMADLGAGCASIAEWINEIGLLRDRANKIGEALAQSRMASGERRAYGHELITLGRK